MAQPQLSHPDKAQLEAFLLGKVGPQEVEEIESHLIGCEPCCQTVNNLKDDTFVDGLRQSHAAHKSAGEADPGAETIAPDHVSKPLTDRTQPETPTAALDPDLADHPRYRILKLLGTGGMGAVYKAEHKLMQRTVALKVINPELLTKKGTVDRFQREVRAAARLDHPNIVRAHDAEQAGDVHFLVMEYVQGTDLHQVIEERGPLPIAEACEYIRQAALGLQHAHEQGMVHRDIKAQNLMLAGANIRARSASKGDHDEPLLALRARSGTLKILDFGLASLTAETITEDADSPTEIANSLPSLTQAGTIMGTPDFMSPEQIDDASAADIRADIYSLGCTLYFLLTGQVPFPEGSAVDKIKAQLHRDPKPISDVRPDVPEELRRVLEKMMAKDKKNRYQTPAEVAEALANADRAARKAATPRRWLVGTLTAAAAALVLLLGGIIYIATDNGQLKIDCKTDDVQVVVSQGGQEVEVFDLKSGATVKRLPSGEYEIAVKGNRTDVKLSKGGFTITRWGRVIVEVTRETVAKGRVPLPDGPPGEVRCFKGHFGNVYNALFTPDGRHVLSCGTDRVLRLWDVASGKQVRNFFGHKNLVVGLAVSPDGRFALSRAHDRTIRLWKVADAEEMGQFRDDVRPIPEYGDALAFSPDGKRVLSGGYDGVVRLWDFQSRKVLHRLEGHKGWVTSAAFAPDGRRVVAGSQAKTALV